jgi:predicted RNA-binding protein with PIN domain
MLIAIDGYNFIKQSPTLRRLEQVELQKAREGLIEQLRNYKRLKGHSFIVVFDGRQERSWAEHRGRSGGIDVIFSRPGEKADEVLKRLASEKREGITVVTSDRDVASFAEKKGAIAVSAADWAEKMDMARFYAVKGAKEDLSAGIRPVAPQKKGPAHRLPKTKRKAAATFKRL